MVHTFGSELPPEVDRDTAATAVFPATVVLLVLDGGGPTSRFCVVVMVVSAVVPYLWFKRKGWL